VAWPEVVVRREPAARLICRRPGLDSFVRTSGGKGLHLVVPLSPPAPWTQARDFARAVADAAREAEPLRYVATRVEAPAQGQDLHRLAAQRAGRDQHGQLLRWARRRRAGGDAVALGGAGAGSQAARPTISATPVARMKRLKSAPVGTASTRLRQSLPE
jgi:bifunctional non-homologous end joining protein LigD